MGKVVSEHRDRVVRDEGDTFRKEFRDPVECAAELERLGWLQRAGIRIPEIVDRGDTWFVTRRLGGLPLDEWIRAHWLDAPRAERNAILAGCVDVCRKLVQAGLAWPDLVSYHLFVGDGEVAVIDPARLRKGKLDLSALYWSIEEPTVSRSDRLRFWKRFSDDAPRRRLRRIGHRGRFRPYRWAPQADRVRACPPWAPFVAAVERDDGIATAADLAALVGRMRVKRTLRDRVNGEDGDLVIKVLADAREAEREWENHRLLMAAAFRVPQPAYGGVLPDGRGILATVRLEGQHPIDDAWPSFPRRALVRAMADVARRLHACGLVHRDLYCCHLFARPGEIDLTLIDLARVEKTRSRRRRVKDLAALVSSARGFLTRTDLWRGLVRYGGDKKLARAVWRKAARIDRHVPRNVKDGTHVPHEPCT